MRLHEDCEVFEQIVKTVADHFGLGAFQVEKDYYVSLFLKELSKVDSDIRVVLKEGHRYRNVME